MRARTDNAFACGPTAEAHVEEAAESKPEESRQNCAEDADHGYITGKVEYTARERELFGLLDEVGFASCMNELQTKEWLPLSGWTSGGALSLACNREVMN